MEGRSGYFPLNKTPVFLPLICNCLSRQHCGKGLMVNCFNNSKGYKYLSFLLLLAVNYFTLASVLCVTNAEPCAPSQNNREKLFGNEEECAQPILSPSFWTVAKFATVELFSSVLKCPSYLATQFHQLPKLVSIFWIRYTWSINYLKLFVFIKVAWWVQHSVNVIRQIDGWKRLFELVP